jgi:ferredoxin
MGHALDKKEELYLLLAERLNKFPEGAPINKELIELLYKLYTESEAIVGSKFATIPMAFSKILEVTKMHEGQLKATLESMAEKGLILELFKDNTVHYMLSPMVVGFFEYTFMRLPRSMNIKELAELFENYFKSSDTRKQIFAPDTPLFRTFVYENVIPFAVQTEIMGFERASEAIRQAGFGAVALCACRHKAEHLGRKCAVNAPMETCTLLGNIAQIAVRRGWAKEATVDEMLQVLQRTEEIGLVHICDNVLNKPTFICHCCKCCCDILVTANKLGVRNVNPSNFSPVYDPQNCIGCGLCMEKCPVGALTMHPSKDGCIVIRPDQHKCIGCGVCVSACPANSLEMSRNQVLTEIPGVRKELMNIIARQRGIIR